VALARALLGTRLVVRAGKRVQVARIVETEAYRGPKDLACHARVGLTPRTRVLLGPPGHGYVYLIYGMYDCFNVVAGNGHAALIRAVEPLSGMGEASTAGPGRLTRAMGITRTDNGVDLTGNRIFLLERDRRPRITVTARVGVAYAGDWADRPYRFYDASSKHVSRPSPKQIGRPTNSKARPKLQRE
jgi:DNA-3-methyladenine glycosylase